MGAAVSNWRLAQAVSRRGHLGVVSGTGIDTVLVRRLQDGDVGGHMRRAMAAFPLPAIADEVLARWYRPAGRPSDQPYDLLPLHRVPLSPRRERLLMLAGFVEVWLAREGHAHPVGINLLTKMQLPTLPVLYGALLGGVDVVLMGAGIPREIPAALDALARHAPAQLRLEVEATEPSPPALVTFDPAAHWTEAPPPVRRPRFFPIVASTLLATVMVRKVPGGVEGLVVEAPTAGGHNAPPRSAAVDPASGAPVYGPKDEVDFARVAELGVPFWVAGGAGRPDGLATAQGLGARGIQVGTLFAFCDESGLDPAIKQSVLSAVARGEVKVHTDGRASPTGYPFKVVEWPDRPGHDVTRVRRCDLGYLRTVYRRPDGRLGYRCPGEPEDQWVAKGGTAEATVGRRCLCNGLLSVIGLAQRTPEAWDEPPILTAGDDLVTMAAFLAGRTRYTAGDVLDYLLASVTPAPPRPGT